MLDKSTVFELSRFYRRHLLEDVMPFWTDRVRDEEYGGYLSCFDRSGTVTDTDKYIWMQGQQLWTFSALYNHVEQRDLWLDLAGDGRAFLVEHAHAGDGRWHYQLDRAGGVKKNAISIFTDLYVLEGLCEYAAASGRGDDLALINVTYDAIERNVQDLDFKEIFPGTWSAQYKRHAIYLTAARAAAVAERVLGFDRTDPLILHCMDQLLRVFARPEERALYESVGRDDAIVDDPEGRLLNPGHALASMAFCIEQTGRGNLPRSVQVIDWMVHRGRDAKHGGLMSFLDVGGGEGQQMDWHEQAGIRWDDKVWWAHAEALHALALTALETHKQEYLQRFIDLHKWCQQHFFDPAHGEWFAVLNRDGTPKQMDKGTPWKAAYHLPRSLMMIAGVFGKYESTLPRLKYAIRDTAIRRGVQTLRHSHNILPLPPLEVGHERQLLMDRHVVDDLNGCTRTVHQPMKYIGNPLFTSAPPHDDCRPSGGTVLREGERLRMWLPGVDSELRKEKGPLFPAANLAGYYESDDGYDWRRPPLGRVERDGSSENHIFMTGVFNSLSVVPLPARMHDHGRYGMFYGHRPEQLADPRTMHHMQFRTAFSEDGLSWETAPESPVLSGRSDTNNCVVYNADRDAFMLYKRATINAGEVRRIACQESEDLINWSQLVHLFGHDELDPAFFYGMPVSRYHGVYFGLLWCLHEQHGAGIDGTLVAPSDRPIPVFSGQGPFAAAPLLADGRDFKMDCQLAWSRDGLQWERHPLRPTFIPNSPPAKGALDWGGLRPIANMIEIGDHVHIYYEGMRHLHSPGDAISHHGMQRSVCLATVERDRFVSIDAGPAGGMMLTKRLAHPGGRLHINARTARHGFIRVAAREAEGARDGEWPEPFRFDRSIAFNGDRLDHVMTWEGHDSLDAFPGRTLRLHFWLEDAELYSFRIG